MKENQESKADEIKAKSIDSLNKGSPNQSESSKKAPKGLIAFILILVLAGLGLLCWYVFRSEEVILESSNNSAQQASQSKSLYYAYKEGKTTRIFKINSNSGQREELFKFEEATQLDSETGNFWKAQNAAVVSSSDGKQLAYIEDSNLRTYRISDQTKTDIIKKTGDRWLGDNPDSNLKIPVLKPELNPNGGPGGIFGIYNPEWSQDGKVIGFGASHYEGSSRLAINLQGKKLLSLEGTFRYGELLNLKEKFTILSENTILAKHGVLASYLFKESDSIDAATFSADRKKIFAILCPLDQPDTGFFQYSEEYEDQLGPRRDCGEPDDKTLISINSNTGTYKELAQGPFYFSMALHNDNLFVPRNSDKNFAIQVFSSDGIETQSIDIAKIGGIEVADIKSVVVRNINRPTAEVYYQKEGKNYVAILDLLDRQKLTQVELSDISAFKTLIIN